MNNQHFSLDALSAYLDAEVGTGERAQIEQHLVTCAGCAATTRRLRSAAGTLGCLDPVQMTVDEHRSLRQAVLRAHSNVAPDQRARRGFGRLQWSLAGAFAVIAVAVLGFAVLRPVTSPETGADSVTEAMAPAENAPLSFETDEQIRSAVLALPEVNGARNRFRVEDAGSPPASAFMPRNGGDAAPNNSTPEAAPEAFSKAAPQAAEDSAAGSASSAEGSAADESTFSQAAGQNCLGAVAGTQTDPLVPLVVRQATYKADPAWLLVYATTSAPFPDKILDEIEAILIGPAACASLTGDALERSILSRSTLKPG